MFDDDKSSLEDELFNGQRYKVITITGTVDKSFFNLFMNHYEKCSDHQLIITLTTTGGELTWAYMLAHILLNHEHHTIMRIPRFAFSAGTIISLACDEIHLSKVACLGPIDPYYGGINITECHDVLKDETWLQWLSNGPWFNVISRYCAKMLGRVRQDHLSIVHKLLNNKYPDNTSAIYEFFTHAKHHGTPIYFNDIPSQLQLKVIVDPQVPAYPDIRAEQRNPQPDQTVDMLSQIVDNMIRHIPTNSPSENQDQNDIDFYDDDEH